MLVVAAETVYSWLQQRPCTVVVVDVRDDDHVGGHIRGSWHLPLTQDPCGRLAAQSLAGYDKIVFHCALSQVRGPSTALRFAREYSPLQQVYVMAGGFARWAQLYGHDELVTADFVPDLW